MSYLPVLGVSLGLIFCCQCQLYQNNGQYNQEQEQQYNFQKGPPPPQILSHKQALNHDGNFKYLFTSENGLAQGESISPDGSRNGGYSYIDPTGRKISVKYTAGKEGFRILEADHLPKAPQPVAPLPAPPQHAAYQPAYQPSQVYNLRSPIEDDGQYKPQLYQRPQPIAIPQPRPSYHAPLAVSPTPSSNAIEPEYNDEPGKPHSFGSGYLFEFSG